MSRALCQVPQYRIAMIQEKRSKFRVKPVCSSGEVYRAFKGAFKDLDREHFAVITCDSKNRPIGFNIVAVGSLNAALVHQRECFKLAVIQNANAVILCHNHPSGSPSPSAEDKLLTKLLAEAGNILGIKVLDHVIFAGRSYYSFADHDLM